MSNVFIIGGAGKIGRRLAKTLVSDGHTARPLYRQPQQEAELRQTGASPVEGDLGSLDSQALAALMQGSDTVVFTAGAGGKGGEAMTNHERETIVFAHQPDGRWLAIHEHLSPLPV